MFHQRSNAQGVGWALAKNQRPTTP